MIFSLVLYSNMLQESWKIKLFLMWVMVHAAVQFLGEIISGAILMQGFGWVMAFMYFTDTHKMLVVIVTMVTMVLTGIFMTRYLMFSAGIYFNSLNKSNRRNFMMSQLVLPFLAGTAILFLIKQPGLTPFEFLIDTSMVLVILPALLRSRFSNEIFFDEEPRKLNLNWLWVLITLFLLVAFRVILGHGIRI
jgi:hypothetical protein